MSLADSDGLLRRRIAISICVYSYSIGHTVTPRIEIIRRALSISQVNVMRRWMQSTYVISFNFPRDGNEKNQRPRAWFCGCRKLQTDRKSTRLNSSHHSISYAVFCLKKKKKK